jgi:DNA-binding IclR family transcriptional regulator
MDTGTGEKDGARYRRALAGVQSGAIRPSIDGLLKGVGASAPVARRYLAAMVEAGVLERTESGVHRLVKRAA